MLIILILSLVTVTIAAIMTVTVIKAKKGILVSVNTIKGIAIAGIIIAIITCLTAFITEAIIISIGGLILLAASILYRLSVKNIKLAQMGALLSIVSVLSIVLIIATAF